MRNTSTQKVVSTTLKLEFINEIRAYGKMMDRVISKGTLFGKTLEMPKTNVLDITNKFINKGAHQLKEDGVKHFRAKSISKYTFEKLLDEEMNNLEGKLY